ncbi:hypothetical protein Clacol_010045 [Clathrus columnatus]|uniref:Uncharacterized protein n=1 Tax=Clathrus columnatus TaxID=1419009 RepID=A0AAV5AM61_9AGAM|nr:hypothetical protein Clacol_010045 [Clathrus columnatus]
MRELPGFYFDENKKRYFPLPSGQKSQVALSNRVNPQDTLQPEVTQPRKITQPAKFTFYDCLLNQQRSFNRISRSTVSYHIICEQLNHTSRNEVKLNNPCSNVPFTSFCAYETAEKEWTFALGDQQVEQLQDVRTSRLTGKSLVIGMRKQALYFPDINFPEITKPLHVGSDVFALCQEDFTIWAGARNGTVRVFDTRISQGMEILHNRFSVDGHRTSITHLRRIHEFELMISTLDGRIELHDTRFIRQTRNPDPSMILEGHIDRNQVTHNLGLAIDPSQEYLFSAGQDCRVRAWSLRTGKQIKTSSSSHASQNALLNREFSAPVLGMQTTTHRNQNMLWLISGTTFEQYEIP